MSAARTLLLALCVAGAVVACGPRAHIPAPPVAVPEALSPDDTGAMLARQLAPTLYLQRDETFPLSRAVAVLHPARRLIAYYLLWRDDAVGAWVPWTIPTDEEVVWVGYDSTHAPTDLWTYWHGAILHTDWRAKGQVLVDVQWGKHGSLPRRVKRGDLPRGKSLPLFYALAWVLPDLWLGNLTRPGPWCFCHGFSRYLAFTRPLLLGSRLDVIARIEEPDGILRQIFGTPYSRKPFWPWKGKRRRTRVK